MNLIRRVINFYKYQDQWLVEYAKESGMSINALVRLAIDQLKFKIENK